MGSVIIEGIPITYSDEFSFRVFNTPKVIIPDNTVVYASYFYQEGFLDAKVFPDVMTGVRFYNCNLDNVLVPPGNIVIGGTNRRIALQNDLRDWEVDVQNKPSKVVNEKYWTDAGKSVDPIDIPAQPLKDISEIKPKPIAPGPVEGEVAVI